MNSTRIDRYCRYCGAAQSEAAVYCTTCGKPVTPSAVDLSAIDPVLTPVGSAPTIAASVSNVPRDATFGRRLAAGLLDIVLAGAALFAALVAMQLLLILIQGDVTSGPEAVGSISTELIVPWLYFAIQEASRARATVGKRAFGMQVETLAGDRLSFRRASGRWWAKWLTLLTFGIGFLMVTWTARHQALHDKVAGTLVRRQS
jgi:uncharacterized RDD family membrane protein YckC